MLDPRGTYMRAFWRHVESNHAADAVIFLGDGDNATATLTYGDLHARALAIAAALAEAGPAGIRILLQLPPGPDFIAGFLGCFYAGAIAIPAPQMGSARNFQRVAAIARDCLPAAVLTNSDFFEAHGAKLRGEDGLANAHWINVDTLTPTAGNHFSPRIVGPDSLAFLQYTSGSTAQPKGVRVTHGNLMANMEMIASAYGHSAATPMVSWLPMYHDMGLIGGLLQPLFCGTFTVIMPPLKFIQKPVRWLRAISRYRPHTSGAPNFGYDLCVDRTTPEERIGLDLSSWKAAFNGAEPVRAATLDRFTATFAEFGFRAEGFYPNYGLAEATLIVSGGSKKKLPVVRRFDAVRLENGTAVSSTVESPASRVLVSSGRTIQDQIIRIVDPDTCAPLDDGSVGEIWVHGRNVADGYWEDQEQTAQTFGGRLQGESEPDTRYLRTGDLGFLLDRELFVTGRTKDLIIHHGRNVYPHDIESAAACDPALPRGASAAFALADDAAEGIVLVHQVDQRRVGDDLDALADKVRDAVWRAEEIPLDAIVFVKPSGIQKTSSGKVMRRAIRQAFLADSLPALHRSDAKDKFADTALNGNGKSKESRSVMLRRLLEFVSANLNLPLESLAPSTALHKIGLDSLDATLLAHRMEVAFGVPLPASLFLRGATIDEVARNLVASGARSPEGPLSPALPGTRSQPPAHNPTVPLSRGQEALFFIHKMAPETSAYNVNLAMDLHPVVAQGILSDALATLVQRHPMLRAIVRDHPTRPRFHTDDAPSTPLRVVQLVEADGDAIVAAVRQQGQVPFDVESEPLFRATLFEHPRGSVLLLTCHHLICDGWSMDMVLGELDNLLAAGVEGREITLPEPSSAAGLLAREERALAGLGGYESFEFWKRRLEGAPTQLTLPFAVSRQRASTINGGSHQFTLPRETAAHIRSFAKRSGTTVFAVLHAAFQALIHRYTGRETFLIGTVASIHRDADLQHSVGYFVNPIILRASISGDQTARDLLTDVQAMLGESLDHREMPFNLLVEQINPERRAERSPFIQVAFGYTRLAFRRDRAHRAADGRPYVEPVLHPQQEGAYDVNLQFFEIDDALIGHLNFNANIYGSGDMARMTGQYQTILNGFVERPDMRIVDLPLMTRRERAWIETRSSGRSLLPTEERLLKPVHAMIARQATLSPQATAVADDDRRFSYAVLDKRADAIAARLIAAGIGPGDYVGVLGHRRITLPEACIGVMRAGAAYVPLAPDLPLARLGYVARDCGLRAVVALDPVIPELEAVLGAPVIEYEEPSETPDVPAPAVDVDMDRIAYVIYTSGSTGDPKGVAVSHGALARRLAWKCDTLDLGANARVLQSISPGFDPSVWELFAPLIAGGRVVLPADDIKRSPSLFIEILRRHEITAFSCVPSFLAHLVEEEALARCHSLRHVITGGEPLSGTLAQAFADRSAARLHHFYGPTEGTIFCTHYEYPGTNGMARLPIGRPVTNTTVRVVDRHGHMAPIGLPGELYIGGDCLASGYVNDPERTRASFVPDPLGIDGEALFYRTGDIVRFAANDTLVFIGRRDDQIKIRGLRIEPAEIEAALERIPGIRHAAVVKHRLGGQEDVLLAHIAVDSSEPDDKEIRQHLGQALPAHMVPYLYARHESLPTLPSGKVNRAALPTPDRERMAETDLTPPRTETEAKLAAIWRTLLDLPAVGIRGNFFDLGGHSLLTLRLLKRIEEEFDLRLPALLVFENPVLASLANLIETKGRSAGQGQTGTTRRFFCVAPGSGDEVRFARLSKALAPGVDLHSLLPPRPDATRELPTVRALAEIYAQQIISTQPSGPYVLGGFSVGGFLALETADALKRTGRNVTKVILLDTIYPTMPALSSWLYFRLKGLARLLKKRSEGLFGTWFSQVMGDSGLETHMAATAHHVPARFDGDVLLVVSQTNNLMFPLLFRKWRKHFPKMRIGGPVFGWHGTMFKGRGIRKLAQVITSEFSGKSD